MIENNNNNHKKRKLRLDIAGFLRLTLSLPRIIRLPSLTLPLMALLSIMLLLVALPTDIYAKYILLAVEDSNMKVAGFEHKVSICPEGELPETWAPGSQAIYSILVSNQSTNGISQTSQTYSIEVVTAGTLPLCCTLLEESEWEESWKEIASFQESPQEKTHIFQTDKMLLPEGCPTEHEYRLMVSWEDACQWEPMDTEDFIRINVNMEQKD